MMPKRQDAARPGDSWFDLAVIISRSLARPDVDSISDRTTRPPPRYRKTRHAVLVLVSLLCAYGLLAYIILPAFWTHYERQKALAKLPMVTRTAQGIPGDPINVGLIGDSNDVLCAMKAAHWFPADPVTWRSSLKIARSVLLNRAYREAPVSKLFYLGRSEDLAFQKPVGRSAHKRHHVRFWKVLDRGEENRPVWLGAVTFDTSVGISRYTGAITHHIDANVDAERKSLTGDLDAAGMMEAKYQVTGIGPTLAGRNGEGDLYYTDGEIWLLRLVEDCRKRDGPADVLASPAATEIKDEIWREIAKALGK